MVKQSYEVLHAGAYVGPHVSPAGSVIQLTDKQAEYPVLMGLVRLVAPAGSAKAPKAPAKDAAKDAA